MFNTRLLSLSNEKCAYSSTFWQFFYYRPPSKFWYTAGRIAKISDAKKSIYSETPHEQPPHEQPPLLWGHIFRHHYIFLTSHLNVNPWWTATPLTWSEASDFGSSHPWRAATQQLLEVASHGIHGWFGCGLTDIHVNHTSGQPWVHRPKACKGVDHT